MYIQQLGAGKRRKTNPEKTCLSSLCVFYILFLHGTGLSICLFPSISVSALTFNPLPIPPSLFICFPLSKKKKKNNPPGGVCLLSIPLFFFILSSTVGENEDAKCQYLDSSSGRQGNILASLHELAVEAVMSRPETSRGQNRARGFPLNSVMTDREIVPTILTFVIWQPDRKCQPRWLLALKVSVWLISPLGYC